MRMETGGFVGPSRSSGEEMATFAEIRARGREVIKEYFALLQAADDSRFEELKRATQIQAAWRRTVAYQDYQTHLRAIHLIQRCFRGSVGRRAARTKEEDRHRARIRAFFDHVATVIQRYFRGFWSRKYLSDFRGRKSYLNSLAQEGEKVRETLIEYGLREMQLKEHRDAEATRLHFLKVASQLHHLVSTESCPGVFNPPYATDVPKSFGAPVEQILRNTCKVKLRRAVRQSPAARRKMEAQRRHEMQDTQASATTLKSKAASVPPAPAPLPPAARPLVSTTASQGRLSPVPGPFRAAEMVQERVSRAAENNQTLQASSPYERPEDESKLEYRIDKQMRVSADEFVVRKPTENPPPISVLAAAGGTRPPIQFREDYSHLPKIRAPFHKAVPQGKAFSDYGGRGAIAGRQ
ncbi:unnamed protein product [Vitrella brassicaformis CCMP3155]|uniref:Uncharacterized protein n=2 Tax=Vitrella brassicaformis TaxID=1169539 RepID=A0A0G4FLK2_VITBC|nr:unnamed protein product [Vitrella brassicaformis CCMP3155]|eukprot:CEM14800.1 unnamed protein product [Vitrella brassicaformis CCMP3155]